MRRYKEDRFRVANIQCTSKQVIKGQGGDPDSVGKMEFKDTWTKWERLFGNNVLENHISIVYYHFK